MNKKILLILLIPLFSLLLISGKGHSSGFGSNPPKETDPCDTKKISLTLYQGNLYPGNIPGRERGQWTFQPTANIFNGLQSKSTPNLRTDTYKNYCVITISSTRCKNYGKKGTKTYLWDSSNDGYSNDNSMDIEVPVEGVFNIKVELYEGCGYYYTNGRYQRAKWKHERAYTLSNIISISDWYLSSVKDCEY